LLLLTQDFGLIKSPEFAMGADWSTVLQTEIELLKQTISNRPPPRYREAKKKKATNLSKSNHSIAKSDQTHKTTLKIRPNPLHKSD
jgi:hypothetical protein